MPTTPQRRIIQILDRPGLRPLLAWLATRYVRRRTGLDVELLYDGAWIHRAGSLYLAESASFYWNAEQLCSWQPELGEIFARLREWWFYRYQPRSGDVIVDVGAGVGEDALLFSTSVGPAGRVFAIEAQPATYRLLETTCRLNHLAHNTTCFHAAIMDQPGTVNIESRADYKSTVGAAQGVPVPALTLDEFCARHGITRIDFLKMNIEGAERLAIQGMDQMINQTRSVCIACHDFRATESEFYRTKQVITAFLRARGFTVHLREQHSEPATCDHVWGGRQ